MQIIRSVRALQSWKRKQVSQKGAMGLVPTMGALHAGHQSLIQRARRSCQTVVVSLFVNPLQFGQKEDLTRYPRSITTDLNLCRQMGADVVFLPSRQDIYPKDFQTVVHVLQLTQRWEGEHRPTHFQGVTTVVTKLLNLVRPDCAFFGQKDYQQYLVMRQLAKDLNMETKIVLCPTIRETGGLAMSSRNQYLSEQQRQVATMLFETLRTGKERFQSGEKVTGTVLREIRKKLASEPTIKIDYVAVCDAMTLEPVKEVREDIVLLGAIRVGRVRLIDNFLVGAPKKKKRNH